MLAGDHAFKLQYMSEEKIRRKVAFEAARLIYTQEETGYFQAKQKAARRFRGVGINAGKLPGDREIRNQIPAVVEAVEALRQVRGGASKKSAKKKKPQDPPPAIKPDDRFRIYELLLLPLENIKEDPITHPEGEVLYHSLQVFELARQALPYDEEFLLASLLHDVGKAIDARNHVAAGLEALDGYITPRTAWMIEHHTDALSLRSGTLGARCAGDWKPGKVSTNLCSWPIATVKAAGWELMRPTFPRPWPTYATWPKPAANNTCLGCYRTP